MPDNVFAEACVLPQIGITGQGAGHEPVILRHGGDDPLVDSLRHSFRQRACRPAKGIQLTKQENVLLHQTFQIVQPLHLQQAALNGLLVPKGTPEQIQIRIQNPGRDDQSFFRAASRDAVAKALFNLPGKVDLRLFVGHPRRIVHGGKKAVKKGVDRRVADAARLHDQPHSVQQGSSLF